MIKVAVIGATGVVGQQFVRRLARHPWFSLTTLVASPRSAHKSYQQALLDTYGNTAILEGLPAALAGLEVTASCDFQPTSVDLIFMAVSTEVGRQLEPQYALTTPVISTTSAFRKDQNTPVLINGINESHTTLLKTQQKHNNWQGFIAPKPNCTTVGLAVSLKPILANFGLKRVVLTSMQAVSGAGRVPGVASLDILANILPFIPGEESKVETESLKILGTCTEDRVIPATFPISATCTRVPVLDGHLLSILVETEKKASCEDIKEAMAGFSVKHRLPSSPEKIIHITDDPCRPQPRLDRHRDDGMAITVGRIEEAFANHIKYICMVPNTGLGAAGGAVWIAEYLVKSFLKWHDKIKESP